jgi:hypothetical protein
MTLLDHTGRPLQQYPYGLNVDKEHATLTVDVGLRYNEKEYFFPYTFQNCSIHGAEYMWTEGNWSCDCNRSGFIADHCDPNFLEMPCGDEIELIKLEYQGVSLL